MVVSSCFRGLGPLNKAQAGVMILEEIINQWLTPKFGQQFYFQKKMYKEAMFYL